MLLEDLDRDHSQMFPLGETPDSAFLYARMAEVAHALLRVGPGARVVDAAAGLGADARVLAGRGVRTTCVEPSRVMTGLQAFLGEAAVRPPEVSWAHGWAEALPFADRSFDAALCKGALDHFDDPRRCIGELARVTRAGGRVVLAVANMDSLGLRLAALAERLRGTRPGRPGRRHHDVPGDHRTRYDARLLREQFAEHVVLEECVGVSLLWGTPLWAPLLGRLAPARAAALLGLADAAARRLPGWADILVLSGRPRAAAQRRSDA